MSKYLITGGASDPLLPKIKSAILAANEIELAVAFIKSSGLELLFQALVEAVTVRGAKLTVLTSDYLDVTDPQALRRLMLLTEYGASIRIFKTKGNQSFHLKAYIFTTSRPEDPMAGSAFIGSSNISKVALTGGIEWNYFVPSENIGNGNESARLSEIRAEFELLNNHPQVACLDSDWIDSYEKQRKVNRPQIAPGSNDPELPPPTPTSVQQDALQALTETRSQGFQRGLVVMATGLGKTYLAAFDSRATNAKKVLFVAHREEILIQAEETFLRVHPKAKVGFYSGKVKQTEAEMIFASVQTLGKAFHLNKFPANHFDYIVVDEFHHAAASTYRKLLNHFQPRFLLGLTATPERTDQSNILSLCDDNLVFSRDLIYGVDEGFLCPFHYYGIYDETVDYEAIPWRNGKFDPESLFHKLATVNRARHVFKQWHEKRQKRTLAFCVSINHAQFMADYFSDAGIKSAAVYGGSDLSRSKALEQLTEGDLEVVFSVELFNEGVDLPAIDTIMMLRPTESKILFLQQLGRGLRTSSGKQHLVILDFIGNHKGFLNKPQALFGVVGIHRELANFAKKVQQGTLELPSGCYVNYSLEIIEFLTNLAGNGPSNEYQALKSSLGRRPTLTEFYHSGASLQQMQKQYGHWFGFLKDESELKAEELLCLGKHGSFYQEIEKTAMTKSYKAVLLESLLENDGFLSPPNLEQVPLLALAVFKRRRKFLIDLPREHQDIDNININEWSKYWNKNPINAWVGGNKNTDQNSWFRVSDNHLKPSFSIEPGNIESFQEMSQELVDFRLAKYEHRISGSGAISTTNRQSDHTKVEIPFFTDLQIACGKFKAGTPGTEEYRTIGFDYGQINPEKHFIACAAGDSMDGGSTPVRDGDYLLLERLESTDILANTGATVVVEQNEAGKYGQFVLRRAVKNESGEVLLKADNPLYDDLLAQKTMRSPARLMAVIDPLEFEVGKEFLRENIPGLFGHSFNPGNWNSGHVVLRDVDSHILLVTLNKQGKAQEHRYHDFFVNEEENQFQWQSQNSTSPESKKGRELIEHEKRSLKVFLFIRERKLREKTAAPFRFYGKVRYLKHEGSQPMNVTWALP